MLQLKFRYAMQQWNTYQDVRDHASVLALFRVSTYSRGHQAPDRSSSHHRLSPDCTLVSNSSVTDTERYK